MKDIFVYLKEEKSAGLSKSKLIELFNDGAEQMGLQEMFDALLKAMSQDQLDKYFRSINRNYELGLLDDETDSDKEDEEDDSEDKKSKKKESEDSDEDE